MAQYDYLDYAKVIAPSCDIPDLQEVRKFDPRSMTVFSYDFEGERLSVRQWQINRDAQLQEEERILKRQKHEEELQEQARERQAREEKRKEELAKMQDEAKAAAQEREEAAKKLEEEQVSRNSFRSYPDKNCYTEFNILCTLPITLVTQTTPRPNS